MAFGVIFDMDGVLLDSTPLLWGGFKDFVRERGSVLPDAHLPSYRGVSWPNAVKRMNQEYGFNANADEFTRFLVEKERESFDKTKYVMPGVTTFLNELKLHHVLMGVGTASNYDRAVQLLEKAGLRDYFSAVASADDVRHHKPAPDIFLAAAQRLNVDPKSCVVIEDGATGVEAAHRGGMKAIGFAEDEHNYLALEKAELIVRSFSELSYGKLAKLMK